MSENKRKSFTIRLDGEVLEIYLAIKKKTGLQSDAEVMRYIITGFDQLRKTSSSSS